MLIRIKSFRPRYAQIPNMAHPPTFRLANKGEDPMRNLDVKVDEALWASSMLPKGVVEQWFVADGAIAAAGAPIAGIRIEGALHDIPAPAKGRVKIIAATNAIIEPGSLLAKLELEDG
jgi:biotin carboxyl carrier protein